MSPFCKLFELYFSIFLGFLSSQSHRTSKKCLNHEYYYTQGTFALGGGSREHFYREKQVKKHHEWQSGSLFAPCLTEGSIAQNLVFLIVTYLLVHRHEEVIVGPSLKEISSKSHSSRFLQHFSLFYHLRNPIEINGNPDLCIKVAGFSRLFENWANSVLLSATITAMHPTLMRRLALLSLMDMRSKTCFTRVYKLG